MATEISDGCLRTTPMSFAFYHNRIKIQQIPEAATSITTSQYKTLHPTLPHTMRRCTNMAIFGSPVKVVE